MRRTTMRRCILHLAPLGYRVWAGQFLSGRSEVADHPLDVNRVEYLVKLLRRRTSEEITTGVMALAGSFTPEMWCALQLLRLQRSRTHKGQRHSKDMPSTRAKVQALSVDDEV
jgi:hypothetical protein